MLNGLVKIDQLLFEHLNSIVGKNSIVDGFFRFTGVYLTYAIPLGLLFFWFYYKEEKIKKMLLAATVAGIFAWEGITHVLGKIINRPRPMIELVGSKEVFFHLPDYSFPSDHMTLMACLATYFILAGYKKAGIISWTLALVIGISRVIGGMHYPGDILAGMIVGSLTAWIFWLLRKPVEKYVVNPIYKLAKLIRMA